MRAFFAAAEQKYYGYVQKQGFPPVNSHGKGGGQRPAAVAASAADVLQTTLDLLPTRAASVFMVNSYSNWMTKLWLQKDCLNNDGSLQDGRHPKRAEGHLPRTNVGSAAGRAARPPDSAPRLVCEARCSSFLNAGWFLTLNYLTGFPGVSTMVSMEVSSLQWNKKMCLISF